MDLVQFYVVDLVQRVCTTGASGAWYVDLVQGLKVDLVQFYVVDLVQRVCTTGASGAWYVDLVQGLKVDLVQQWWRKWTWSKAQLPAGKVDQVQHPTYYTSTGLYLGTRAFMMIQPVR